jgi:hypothetical protein
MFPMGPVAVQYHTAWYRLVPSLAKALNVPTPAIATGTPEGDVRGAGAHGQNMSESSAPLAAPGVNSAYGGLVSAGRRH